MLPLVSTFPLHNVRFLLLEPVYRQQHVCSNLLTTAEHASIIGQGFLGENLVVKSYHSVQHYVEPCCDTTYCNLNTSDMEWIVSFLPWDA